MRRFFAFFSAFFLLTSFDFHCFSQAKPIHLLIDPGHGGRDPGKPGITPNNLHEKDINLSIALKLGGYIRKKMKGVKVSYTRTKDVFVSLEERVNLANRLKVNYFLSIHCNSNPRASIFGAKLHIHSHKGKESRAWARIVQNDLVTRAKRTARGVVSAHDRGYNLYVLRHTRMPALLAELGFLSNKTENRYLSSEQGQVFLASSLFRAFRTLVEKRAKADARSFYGVQIMASRKRVPLQSPQFKKLGLAVRELRRSKTQNGKSDKFVYKYVVGKKNSRNEAEKLAKRVKKLGFSGAFIVRLP